MRHRRVGLTAAGLACGLVLLAASFACAEPFVDLYMGAVIPGNAATTLSGGGATASGETDWTATFSVGGRVGYWFERTPWLGVGLDLSWYQTETDAEPSDQKLRVIPLSALVMFRYPLVTSAEYPKGRLQPYIGVGPAIFFSHLNWDISSVTNARIDDSGTDIGVDVRGGMTWMFTKRLGLFGEYRFTHTQAEYDALILGVSVKDQIDLNHHHFQVGLTYRF